ncbi:MAG TPA: sulfite exporter TauE/SafE family protein [Gammaproteobacteria bacterium]|nr:sulfite exporter TauE/SafE family protein [Gammaproteobacteria bacterium]
MTSLLTVLLILCGGLVAGLIGSLTGLGGGMIIVPLLTLVFHMPIPEAVGISLFGVIATSTGAAPRFVGTGLNNVRVALFLQVAASSGALAGAVLAHHLSARFLFMLFGVVLGYSAIMSFLPKHAEIGGVPQDSPLARRLRLGSRYQQGGVWVDYHVTAVLPGFVVMLGAGLLSALLGIGSGAFKVLALDRLMRLPFRVSTATSNFMIGVTAATSVGYYLSNGDVSPILAAAVVFGVLAGAYAGGHLVKVLPVKILRRLFGTVLLLIALQMLVKGVMNL